MQLTVLIPALNESARVGAVIERARRYGGVIVVDDGSTDGTDAVARRAGATVMRHPLNRGKGAAVRTGFAHILGTACDAVVTLDADGQHDPAEIPRFAEALLKTGAGIVNGDRMHAPAGMPWTRIFCNRRGSAIVSAVAGCPIPDALIGYRIVRMDVLRAVFPALRSDRYEIDPEILLRAACAGFRIGSLRVACVYGDERSRIRPLLDAHRFFGLVRAIGREKRVKG